VGRIQAMKRRANQTDFSRSVYPRNTSKGSRLGKHKGNIVECKWCHMRNAVTNDECLLCGSDDFK